MTGFEERPTNCLFLRGQIGMLIEGQKEDRGERERACQKGAIEPQRTARVDLGNLPRDVRTELRARAEVGTRTALAEMARQHRADYIETRTARRIARQ